MEDIEKLKRKRKMKGEPLGRALLGVLANTKERQRNPETPIYTDVATIAQLATKFQEGREEELFRFYDTLYLSLATMQNRAIENYNIIVGTWNSYLFTLNQITDYRNMADILESEPLILPEEKYTKLRDDYRYSVDEVSFFLLKEILTTNCVNAPKRVLDALEAAEIPAEATMVTYQELPDGRRSDQYSQEEWDAILMDMFLDHYDMSEYESNAAMSWDDAIDRDYEDPKRDKMEHINGDRLDKMRRHYFLKDLHIVGETDEDIDTTLIKAIEWSGASYLIRPSALFGPADEALRKMLDIPILPITLKETAAQLDQCSWEENVMRYALNSPEHLKIVGDYVQGITGKADSYTYSGLQAAGLMCEGLASQPFNHLKESTNKMAARRAGAGVVTAPYNRTFGAPSFTTPLIFPAKEKKIIKAMQFLYSFNEIIGVVADVYEVPELAILKYDLTDIEEHVEAYNERVCRLYSSINCIGAVEVMNDMRENIDLINLEEARPRADKVEEYRETLRKSKYSRNAMRLFIYPEAAIGGFYK